MVGAGLKVMSTMIKHEVSALAGPKSRHDPGRVAVRHGHDDGQVTLGGRQVANSRPRLRAFADIDPVKGYEAANRIASELKADHTDAAASLLEGLEEMFTVRQLGVNGRLAATLTNANCIESMISVARTTIGDVKRWKDGSMKKRWVSAGMLEAERNFRRVRGCKEMPTLIGAFRRQIASDVTGVRVTNPNLVSRTPGLPWKPRVSP